MNLKALQIAGIGAVIIFGAQLVLMFTSQEEEGPARFAVGTAGDLAAGEAGAVVAPPQPRPVRRLVESAIAFDAMGLEAAEEAYYCEGIITLGAADDAGRISDDDRALTYRLSDYGNDLAGARGVDRDTAMVARQQRLLQAQYDLEDGLGLMDVEACRMLARSITR